MGTTIDAVLIFVGPVVKATVFVDVVAVDAVLVQYMCCSFNSCCSSFVVGVAAVVSVDQVMVALLGRCIVVVVVVVA